MVKKERNETARDECCQETVITSRKRKKKQEENTLSYHLKLKSDELIQDEDVLSCFQDILHFMRTGMEVEWSRCFRDVLDILIKSLCESTQSM